MGFAQKYYLHFKSKKVREKLLDFFPNAVAAYSLRQLRTGVTNVVRVRRSQDNAEQDFTASQITDGTLENWVGFGNDGFISLWYNQSTIAINLSQSITSKQPKIVEDGIFLGYADFTGFKVLDCETPIQAFGMENKMSYFDVVKLTRSAQAIYHLHRWQEFFASTFHDSGSFYAANNSNHQYNTAFNMGEFCIHHYQTNLGGVSNDGIKQMIVATYDEKNFSTNTNFMPWNRDHWLGETFNSLGNDTTGSSLSVHRKEFIVFNRELPEHVSIRNEINNRYNIF